MTYLDFEKPIQDLEIELEKLKEVASKSKVDLTDKIKELEGHIQDKIKEIYSNLTAWQKVQVSRHPERPYTLAYIDHVSNKSFIELHGDRTVGDDKAMVGGFGEIDGETVMFIGQQKGINTKMRQIRRFGMANPEGYRKALRLMKLAEKFNKPIVTFIDTPGAYPGLEAEERGQGEAIAKNLLEMAQLKVPVICIIIGEGASGGALGIGIGDKVLMLENTWYSVISPESCSSILWRSWNFKEKAAEALKLTAGDMSKNGLIDGVIPEPVGGAHRNHELIFETVKQEIKKHLSTLKKLNAEDRINQRIEKFSSMGVVHELED
ncbi:MAG: acetyl-CoA carboxylase carboxyltransferase subunit alpha [Sphingobacteriaceae bacterium]